MFLSVDMTSHLHGLCNFSTPSGTLERGQGCGHPQTRQARLLIRQGTLPNLLAQNHEQVDEGAVAKRMQHDIVAHELIPTTQFGRRLHSSCLDAGITLIHDVQTAHAVGLKVGILLFDI